MGRHRTEPGDWRVQVDDEEHRPDGVPLRSCIQVSHVGAAPVWLTVREANDLARALLAATAHVVDAPLVITKHVTVNNVHEGIREAVERGVADFAGPRSA